MTSSLAGALPGFPLRRGFAALVAASVAALASTAILSGGSASDAAPPGHAALPVAFVANAGQSDARVRYMARSGGLNVFLTDRGVTLSLAKGGRAVALELSFVGANPAPRIVASKRASGTVSYLGAGRDSAQAGLPTYGELTYRNLWPGIDLALRDEGGSLKYEFHVAPGADPGDIALAYRGADRLSLAGGALAIETALGTLSDARPVSYQGSHAVASEYRLEGSQYGFALPAGYDRSQPLVIDPGIAYSTFLGGVSWDEGDGIAVDVHGSAYVVGAAASPDYPATVGAYDPSFGGDVDVVVTKLAPGGSQIMYSTFLGGDGQDSGAAIAIDAQGYAYITGLTSSADFPTTAGAYDTSYASFDGFVTKLAPSGTALAYSTFLGGTGSDHGLAIAVDALGGAYVAGRAGSGFPTTDGAYDTSPNGGRDGFVTKLLPSGTGLAYSTLLGGTGNDDVLGLAIDGEGSAYVAGAAGSANFPTTADAYDTSYAGSDVFVTKLKSSGADLSYSTFLGDAGGEQAHAIAVDGQGSAYVTGSTASPGFPASAGAYDTTHNGSLDAFVTKLAPSGGSVGYSTFLGSSASDRGSAIAVDAQGSAYVAGFTSGPGFPTTEDAYDTTHNGLQDAFVSKLAPSGDLDYATILGGNRDDEARGLGLDPQASAYITGVTHSLDFPVSAGAYDRSHNGDHDGFVTKLAFDTVAPSTGDRMFDASVPAVLSLELGVPPSFGAILPGRTRTYEVVIAALVTVTSADALLTVHDPSPLAPGHLVNGTSVLPSPLRARAGSLDGIGAAYADVGGTANPTTLLVYPGQAAGDPVTLAFQQPVDVRDKLRTGSYRKQLTFTLATTNP